MRAYALAFSAFFMAKREFLSIFKNMACNFRVVLGGKIWYNPIQN